jgi:ATP-dependent helicase HrpB
MHDKAEILRADLCEPLLALHAAGVTLAPSDWLQAPPADAVRAAQDLLDRLGATDARGALTERGRRMTELPVHPRLVAIALQARAEGRLEEGCTLAALLGERDIVRQARARFGEARGDVEVGPSDALDRLERFERVESSGFSNSSIRSEELDAGAIASVRRVRDRMLRSLERGRHEGEAVWGDAPLLKALLAGFGDRVAKRRAPGSDQLVLGRGGSLKQAPLSVVQGAELVVILDAQEQPQRGNVAHLVSAIEPEMLLELWPERVVDRDEVRFDAQRERVERTQGLSYEGISLDESQGLAEPDERTAAILAEAAKNRGLHQLFELEAVEHFERRVRHASRVGRKAGLPDDARERALRDACLGKRTFAELRSQPQALLHALMALVPSDTMALLDRFAPDDMQLPGGRRLRITYEADRPPWVASRMQDFFGMQRGPMLGDEPLVLHLLAPNQRPVQVTTDLANFWQTHYPELRKQLMRRYPRHAWPEDPKSALPPAPKR